MEGSVRGDIGTMFGDASGPSHLTPSIVEVRTAPMDPLDAHELEPPCDHRWSQGEDREMDRLLLPRKQALRTLAINNLNGGSNAALCHTRPEPS